MNVTMLLEKNKKDLRGYGPTVTIVISSSWLFRMEGRGEDVWNKRNFHLKTLFSHLLLSNVISLVSDK